MIIYRGQSAEPRVKLFIVTFAYNLMMEALHDNAAEEYDPGTVTTHARGLIEKIEKYAALIIADNGTEGAEISFSEREAAELVWQLIIYTAGLVIPREDFYAALKSRREEEAALCEEKGDDAV